MKSEKTSKIVLTFGTFDIFHPGHEHYLSEAKKHGDTLIVIIARDQTVKKIKGRPPRNTEDIRKKNLEQSNIADEITLGSLNNPFECIEKYRPDVLCF